MLKNTLVAVVLLSLSVAAQAQGPRQIAAGDWPELRGPHRDGTSSEAGLPESWALNGENFLWRAPYGGRSTPVVHGDHLYVQNASGRDSELQERVMCLDANTGAVLWEYKFTNFQSDVPTHRLAWASPAVDPETGNVYVMGSGAMVTALSKDGTPLWHRSIGEEFAAFTTHGGRTTSPLVDGDVVIVNAAVSNWGEHGARRLRFIAMDKRTGEIDFVSTPGTRPYDTSYSPALITTIAGQRLLISGLGNGAVHAIKPQTGEVVWSYPMAKRAVNTAVAVRGTTVFVSHGDENLDTAELGMIAAIDGNQTGIITTPKWVNHGVQYGVSSPILDGTRIYIIDGGSTLHAFDAENGKELWQQRLGTGQQLSSPVFADGKLYVGTTSGKFLILRPGAEGVEVLSEVELPVSTFSCCSAEGIPEQVIGGAAVSRGRVFFQSGDALYAIGPKQPKALNGWAVDEPASAGEGEPAWVQVTPAENNLRPGQTVTLRARLFDARGRFLRESPATWSLDGLNGTVTDGTFVVSSDPVDQAGKITATVGALTGSARARVSRSLPWTDAFDSYDEGTTPPGWSGMTAGQFTVTMIDGQKALQKKPLGTLFKRIRAFIGPTTLSNYTIQADIQAPTRRRQQADVGITAQTYSLVAYGTVQKLKLEPWEPEITRTVTTDFDWEPDTWQTLKLRVENLPNGTVKIQGKAWKTGTPEPAGWAIEKTDPIGNDEGAPGFFIDAEFGAFVDNVSVTPN